MVLIQLTLNKKYMNTYVDFSQKKHNYFFLLVTCELCDKQIGMFNCLLFNKTFSRFYVSIFHFITSSLFGVFQNYWIG